jgi:uncharacterized protein YfaS (alpha-2-macroglobulin family)
MGQQIALVLIANMAMEHKQKLKKSISIQLPLVKLFLNSSSLPSVQALMLMQDGKRKIKAIDTARVDKILSQVQQQMPTFDRALTLVWLQKSMSGVPAGKPVNVKLRGDWKESVSTTGNKVWQFMGTGLKNLNLSEAPLQPVTATINYNSSIDEPSSLPIRIERRLYLLKPGSESLQFDAEVIREGASLNSGELYMEEITLSQKKKRVFRHGLLEVPLPPGADVERTTWGMKIKGIGSNSLYSMEKTRHEMGQMSYSVPIDVLKDSITVRHLVRFSQKGKFTLPSIRYFQMYQPQQKAFEAEGKTLRVVEVR